MENAGQTTVRLQGCLARLQAGEEKAREELLEAACGRLTRLARKMFRDSPRLKRWQDTDDVLQSALLRLYRALQEVTPEDLRQFFRLASLQIRRELIDLARHYFGPKGLGARHHSQVRKTSKGEAIAPADDPTDLHDDPGQLVSWSEFHEAIAALPENDREVVELVWYQGLTHAETGRLLDISKKTVQRRWQAACLKLDEKMGGELPGL